MRQRGSWRKTVLPIGIAALLACLCGLLVKQALAPRWSGHNSKSAFKLPLATSVQLVVAPNVVKALAPDTARAMNARVPFSKDPNPAAKPFRFEGSAEDMERAVSCLSAAQLYEAGGDPRGQRAVAQVVLNRLRHPAFPKTICDVVFQGAERSTGCQFTFTCDGAMARKRPNAAWEAARTIAMDMLTGAVFAPVGYATHYHTDWVVPYWSETLDKITALGTHLFFRWTGGWGRPSAFGWHGKIVEPRIRQLAQVSPVHDGATALLPTTALLPSVQSANGQPAVAKTLVLKDDSLLPEGVKLVSRLPEANVFIIQFPDSLDSRSYGEVARTLCKAYSECNLMIWTASAKAPSGFPLKSGVFSSMAFNYVQDEAQGSHRMFWNCRHARPPTGGKCMGDRADP